MNLLRLRIASLRKQRENLNLCAGARETARYFHIDGKVARAAIAKGEYQDFLLGSKEVSNRKTIYVFDSNSHDLLEELKGTAKALKIC